MKQVTKEVLDRTVTRLGLRERVVFEVEQYNTSHFLNSDNDIMAYYRQYGMGGDTSYFIRD